MRILSIAANWVFIFCLPVLLLTAIIGCAVNSSWLYRYGFEKYDVGSVTDLTDEELEKVAEGLISYFNSSEEYINLTVMKNGGLFNEKEISHLRDVKKLIWLDYWILIGTLVYALGYTGVCLFWHKRRYWRRLAWSVVGGGGIALVMMLALWLGTLLNFDRLFLQFHFISFSNDFWQLDPTSDYLIMLFPQGFWYDATLFCALGIVVMVVILCGVGGSYLVFTRKALHFRQ